MPRMPRRASDIMSKGAVRTGPARKPSGQPRAAMRSACLVMRSMLFATASTALAKALKESASGPEAKEPTLPR